MILDHATLDFETYYDQDFSLSKLQTDEYILDERFEIIGVSVKPSSDSEIEWFSGTHKHTKEFLQDTLNWKKAIICCQNTNFDGFIATQVLGLKPRMWMDTLGMARMLYPWWPRFGLARLAENLELGVKGRAVQDFKGYGRLDFSPLELQRYGNYCKNDTALTHSLSQLMLPRVPMLEMVLIDMEVRMFTEPQFEGDLERLIAYHKSEVARKEDLLASCAAEDKSDLMSNNKFAALLLEHGIDPPTKVSPKTGKVAFAFAKTDKGLTALLDHPDSDVQALVAARMGVKSTLAETRALRFIHTARRSKLPVYIHHWGAKTTGRQSGGNKMNFLNIPSRGDAKELRRCMVAPPGHKVVVGDSSNIELRVAMVGAGQADVVERLWEGIDEYCVFAGQIYGRKITKADKDERTLGKVAMLSLQYQTGAETFINMVRIMTGRVMTRVEGQKIVSLYRHKYDAIQDFWWHCDKRVLNAICNGDQLQPVDTMGWALTDKEGFSLPGSPGVCYHNLHKGPDGWLYEMSGHDVNLYGGKTVENWAQHLARQIVLWQTALVHQQFPVALSVYDEIVCVVPDNKVDECVEVMEYALAKTPAWCRDEIPLAGEIEVGQNYGEAK